MKQFAIITDSCSDLCKEHREKYNLLYARNTYSFSGQTYYADLDWKEHSFKEFYDIMRDGNRIITSQVNEEEYRKVFSSVLEEGFDILALCCSTGLSSSYYNAVKVRDELLVKYPSAKIVCIDALISSHGLGLLCIRASEMRSSGATIEEVAQWVEQNKLTVQQEGTVDKLIYLKQAGRVSAASAFFGGLLNIKPIIISDIKGRNIAVEKIKGQKASFKRIAERVAEKISDVSYQKIIIGHADCLENAEEIKKLIIEALPNKTLDIEITYICQMIGASCGPGMVGIYYYGPERTFDGDSNK